MKTILFALLAGAAAATTGAKDVPCTMDVDFSIRGMDLSLIKTWDEFHAAAKVSCATGETAEFDLVGEGPWVGRGLAGRTMKRRTLTGKAYGLGFRLPEGAALGRLAGEYHAGEGAAVVDGTRLTAFLRPATNRTPGIALTLPTGALDAQGTPVDLDIRLMRMTARRGPARN